MYNEDKFTSCMGRYYFTADRWGIGRLGCDRKIFIFSSTQNEAVYLFGGSYFYPLGNCQFDSSQTACISTCIRSLSGTAYTGAAAFQPVTVGRCVFSDSRTASQTIEQQNIDPRPFGIDFDTVKGDGIDAAHKKIMVTTANYYPLILKLTQHIKDYEGYEVYMIGFVSYDDKSLTNNNFTLARYLMACCINDVSPFGLICNYSGDIHWKEYQWLAVKGQLGYREYHGLIQPTIAVKEVVPAKRVAGYIYPY